jgi:SDR family mycofactocin-dependent oxidoreductase
MDRVAGKVAIVTGAARGQGRAHAVRLAEEGADVIAIDICEQIGSVPYPLATESDLQQTVKSIESLGRRAMGVVADVREQSALDDVVANGISTFGKIDYLVANAGIFGLAPFWEISDSEWDDMLAVNLTGVWRTAKAVAPHMMERRQGAMVLAASNNSVEGGVTFAHYTAAKHGVLGLTRVFALELAPYNVRVNAICPGAMDTAMLRFPGLYDFMAGHPGGTEEDLQQGARHWHALPRSVINPKSAANAALFLLSDEAADVTGVYLHVDAGHEILPGINQSPADL